MASLVLILAAVGLAVAAAVAGLSRLLRPGILSLLERLPVEQRANLLLLWALLPLLAGLLTVMAVVTPSLLTAAGLMADHCLLHGTHHSHLCLLHPGTTPTIPGAAPLLGLLAGSLLVWAAVGGWRLERAIRPWRTLRHVAASESATGVRILDTARPLAATVGLLRPTVLVSRGLMDGLSPQAGRAIWAHEAAHRRRRDPLRLALARLGTALHLPGTGRALKRELELAVERAADEAAAGQVGDRVTVAEALLAVARMRPVPAPGLGFTQDPLEIRVRALLADAPTGCRPRRGVGSAFTGLAVALLALSPRFHHGLETLLGHL
jgi:Zn-dependent protease with chaperone function